MALPNIILTGFMGTGKSTVGPLLAEKTGRAFIDTDQLIENRTGRSIAELFEGEGEGTFRRWEAIVARELSRRQALVIATGGRLMLDPLNAARLGRDAFVVCLTAEPEEILARLAQVETRRPLLEGNDPGEQVRALLAARAEAYNQFTRLPTDGRVAEELVDEALLLYREWLSDRERAMAPTSRLPVRFPGGEYPVFVGSGLLGHVGELTGLERPAVVITDQNVGSLHASRLGGFEQMATITIPAGEEHKNLSTASDLYGRLLAAGLDRRRAVVALGGGVVGDLAGFVAATFMRGVPFIQCPTTLLAMVDASVGGKTGVNLPQGKNLVGAFKQPLGVLADLDALLTLPPAEVSAGLAEVVKHGLIASPDLFADLEQAPWSPAELAEARDLQALVVEAIMIKRDVVEADPYEGNRRMILNLGHTFAHAIEQLSDYKIAHGFAVSMGLVAAARLSHLLGYCPPELAAQVAAVLEHLELPADIPARLDPADMVAAMRIDKKRDGSTLPFVLLRAIGDVFLTDDVPEEAVLAAIREGQKRV